MRMKVLALCLFMFASTLVLAQESRDPFRLPKTNPKYAKAIKAGTRTLEGKPGEKYWSNRATYDIEASLDPETAIVTGKVLIRFTNNSPRRTRNVRIHLRQNFHKDTALRNRPAEVTGGVEVKSVQIVDPDTLKPTNRIRRQRISGTVMSLSFGDALASGATMAFQIEWSYKVPKVGAPRNGRIGKDLFYLGYWYPQMAVFDDVEGWVADNYMGNSEFYMGYADYKVAFTLPANFVVRATGVLTNAKDVLSDRTLARLEEAKTSDKVVRVVTKDEAGQPGIMKDSGNGLLTWKFDAKNVRDFAIGAANDYLWDATHAKVGKDKPDCMIHSVYRARLQRGWNDSATYAKHAIEYMSRRVYPYPYPHMSVCEGAVGGGMEYPMMTAISAGNRRRSVQGVIAHELIHMWFPMIAGSNEKRYAWMDEGMTSALTALAGNDFWNEDRQDEGEIAQYASMAGSDWERPSMTHGDYYGVGRRAYGVATYSKTSAVFLQLMYILGEDVFFKTLKDYVAAWAFKHPRPEDLFASFSRVSGQDLGWYFRAYFHEVWTLDQSVEDVTHMTGKSIVTVVDLGLATGPTTVEATLEDGSKVRKKIPAKNWMQGKRRLQLEFAGKVVAATVDPDRHTIDRNRRNNGWKAE